MAQEAGRRTPEARLPATIGRYKVVSRIGKGAMGVVYHAHDELMDRAVAIKVLTADLAGDPSIRTRFFREAKVAGQIVHPNVITVFDMGEENGRLYIVMELLQGQTLGEYLRGHPGLGLAEKLDIMTQVCSGMVAAHGRGIVHRDLKPSNLFVQTDGVVKLLDFGVARLADSNVTAAGLIIGTPDYMSPEQARGGEIDLRADVFSAGSVFYFLLTGRRPFAARDLPTLLHNVEYADPPPMAEADAPATVSAIVMKALQKDPARRYQSFSDLLADVLRFHKAYEAEGRKLLQATRAAFRDARQQATTAAAAAAVLGYESRATAEVSSLLAQHPALDEAEVASDAERAALLRDLPSLSGEVVRIRDQCTDDARRAGDWLARHRAAEGALAAGDLAGAERELAAVVQQQPAAVASSAMLARVRAAIQDAQERARRERALIAAAETSLKAGHWAEAGRLAEEALGVAPGSARAGQLREQALDGLAREQERTRRLADAEARVAEAGLTLARGDAQGAARLAQEALALDATNETGRAVLARAQAAITEAAAREVRLTKARSHAVRAQQWLEKGRLAKAIGEARRALALQPDDVVSAALIEEARRRQAVPASAATLGAGSSWVTPRNLGLAAAAVVLAGLVIVVGGRLFGGRDSVPGDAGTGAPPPSAAGAPRPEPVSPDAVAPPSGQPPPQSPAQTDSTVPPATPATPEAIPAGEPSDLALPELPRAAGEDESHHTTRRAQALASFNEAQDLLRRGRFQQALAIFEGLGRTEPAYPGIEERIAATRREVEAGARPSARRLLEEGARLEASGNMLDAMARYRAARAAEPDLPGLGERISSLSALMTSRAERLVSEGDADRGRGDPASAIRKYEEALRYFPPDHPAVRGVRQQLEKLRAGVP